MEKGKRVIIDPEYCEQAAPLLSLDEMQRVWAITDVVFAYNQELNHEKQNLAAFSKVRLGNPSAPFISHRMAQEFHEWCPVKLTLSSCVLVNSILSVLNYYRSRKIRNYSALRSQKTSKRNHQEAGESRDGLQNPLLKPVGHSRDELRPE